MKTRNNKQREVNKKYSHKKYHDLLTFRSAAQKLECSKEAIRKYFKKKEGLNNHKLKKVLIDGVMFVKIVY